MQCFTASFSIFAARVEAPFLCLHQAVASACNSIGIIGLHYMYDQNSGSDSEKIEAAFRYPVRTYPNR